MPEKEEALEGEERLRRVSSDFIQEINKYLDEQKEKLREEKRLRMELEQKIIEKDVKIKNLEDALIAQKQKIYSGEIKKI